MVTYIGIDVSKAEVSIAVHSGDTWTCPTTSAALDALATRLGALHPALVVMEATGGYEAPVAAALTTAGLAVAVVNPRQVRAFAQAIGQTAKTDAIVPFRAARSVMEPSRSKNHNENSWIPTAKIRTIARSRYGAGANQ